MPYIGAGGKEFMSSVLAKASMPGGYTQPTTTSQPSWLSSLVQSSQAANIANKQRETEIRSIYDEIIRRYQPGGSFEAKSLAELESQKKRSVGEQFGTSEQQAISGGMFGVQRPTRGGMGLKWEERVGAPARLGLEDVLMQRLTSAQTGMAGFLERIEDTGPSLSDIYGMAQAGTSTPSYSPTPEYREPGGQITSTPISTSPQVYGQSAQGTKDIPGASFPGETYAQIQARAKASAGTPVGGNLISGTDWAQIESQAQQLTGGGGAGGTGGSTGGTDSTAQSESDRIIAAWLATGKWKMSPNGQLVRK